MTNSSSQNSKESTTQKRCKVLIAIPEFEYDPSEIAIPWKALHEAGHDITVTTPSGNNLGADPIMLSGKTLGLFKPFLMADKNGLAAYQEMEKSEAFLNPTSFDRVRPDDYDLLYLPGGHAKGVIKFIDSECLWDIIAHFFQNKKLLGAVCHGVLAASRSINPNTGKAFISEYKTTALLRTQEIIAWNLSRLWLGDYYRTYPGTTVEGTIRDLLEDQSQFLQGPLPIFRDSPSNHAPGFVCRDRNYISARWPGDCHKLGKALCDALSELSEIKA